MRTFERLIPAATVVVLALVAALPLGFSAENKIVALYLPLMAIHFWVLRWPGHIPEWLVFGAGLVLDVMTGAPPGHWALIYLIGYGAAVVGRRRIRDNALAGWMLFAAVIVLLSGVQWCVSTLYNLAVAGWQPLVYAGAVAILAYPAAAAVLSGLDGKRRRSGNVLLERGV